MDKLFCLDKRLMLCASLVDKNARLADIGTDHGYLPVWLLKNNLISFAIASDVNQKPLDAGRKNAEKYRIKNIDFRLGNGLETITPKDNIDTIVIAGMGGELICEILNNNPLIKNNVNLILQPMTKCSVLINYLYKNGFEIIKQEACESHNKHYTVLLAKYTGKEKDVDDMFSYIGKLNFENPAAKAYIAHQISNLENKGKGDEKYKILAEKIKEKIKCKK